MPTIEAKQLRVRDVIRVKGSARGLGRKCVISTRELSRDGVSLEYLVVGGGGTRLVSDGWTTLRPDERTGKIGSWDGIVSLGADGSIKYDDSSESEGEGAEMATATKTRKTAAKKGGKTVAKKSGSKNDERSRASNDELDEQAAEVVRLRDEEELSWAEVAEESGIAMSRLRGLYNRGGGEATRERRGAAKAKPKDDKKSAKGKGKKRATKADPSE